MYDNFIDVLLYVLSEEWFYIALLVLVLTVVLVANYHLDDNDLKLEALEAERSDRLRARLAEDGDEQDTLAECSIVSRNTTVKPRAATSFRQARLPESVTTNMPVSIAPSTGVWPTGVISAIPKRTSRLRASWMFMGVSDEPPHQVQGLV